MVDQLNQDPHTNSMTDSGQGTVSMEGGRTNITGDEEVETRNEGPTVRASIDPGVGDLVWDPQDQLFKFNNENLGMTQTPVAASTLVVAGIKDEMLELEDMGPEDPPQVSLPRSPGTQTSPVIPPRGSCLTTQMCP